MSCETHKLKEASRDDAIALQKYLQTKLPYSHQVLSATRMVVAYNVPIKIHIPSNPDARHHIVVLTNVTTGGEFQSMNVYYDQKDACSDDIEKYLRNVPNWEWSQKFVLQLIQADVFKHLEPILDKLIEGTELGKITCLNAFTMTLDKLKKEPRELRAGFKVAGLQPHHVQFLFNNWGPQCAKEDPIAFGKNLKRLPSYALFKDTADVSIDNPVSYMVQYQTGYIGMTFTESNCRRMGLATYVETKLVQELLDRGINPSVHVDKCNKDSIEFHKRFGYKKVSESDIYIYVEKGSTMYGDKSKVRFHSFEEPISKVD